MGLLFTDEADVLRTIKLVKLGPNDFDRTDANSSTEALVEYMEIVRNVVLKFHDSISTDFFLYLAAAVRLVSEFQAWKFPSYEWLAALIWGKHQAYTDKPLRRWGAMGVVIRIDSKLERFLSMRDKPDQNGESVVDTLADMFGYCVLGYALLKDIQK